MGTSKVFSSFFFLFFFLVMISANIYVLANDCSIPSNYLCSSLYPYGLVPRFPFRIKDRQPDSCGYPGFSLTCNNTQPQYRYLGKDTVLELPLSGKFFVKEIDYVKQKIVLTDPNGCLPKRLLYTVLNLSDSPFKSVYYQNYTFLNCTYQILYESILSNNILFCFGIGNGYVLATSSMTLVGEFQRYCQVIKTVSVPVPVPIGYDSFLRYDSYRSNITLSWDEPDCRYCEERNLGCKLRNKNSHETRCRKNSRLTAGAISGICIGIGWPALLGIICYVACCNRGNSYDDENQPSNADFSNVTSSQPVIPLTSFNDSIIDSYPKIVLGESRRLPKPDDDICPICLLKYIPKDILKIIPECNHNFHTHCIDKWLHMNMTCPVCRNSLTQDLARI